MAITALLTTQNQIIYFGIIKVLQANDKISHWKNNSIDWQKWIKNKCDYVLHHKWPPIKSFKVKNLYKKAHLNNSNLFFLLPVTFLSPCGSTDFRIQFIIKLVQKYYLNFHSCFVEYAAFFVKSIMQALKHLFLLWKIVLISIPPTRHGKLWQRKDKTW